MYPLLGDDDRENMTRIWQMVMPADAFAGAVQLVRCRPSATIASELYRRIPDLAACTAARPVAERTERDGKRRPSSGPSNR